MPVKVKTNLPSIAFLEKENIFVMSDERAERQEIRPLKVAILNLMPNKVATETQLLRHIANSPLQCDVVFLRTASYQSKNVNNEYLESFYKTFEDIIKEKQKFDALIVTGAPVEKMDFKEVAYWDELKNIMKWAEHNVYSSMYICWAAQAAVYYLYGINKTIKDNKICGVYEHKVLNKNNPLVRGFNDTFAAPHSRYTEVDNELMKKNKNLEILAVSDEAGIHLAASKDLRKVFIFGHGEYDLDTLHNEYTRDIDKGINPMLPKHYYINDKVGALPPNTWRAHESLLFMNWINYCVYQATPYDIENIN